MNKKALTEKEKVFHFWWCRLVGLSLFLLVVWGLLFNLCYLILGKTATATVTNVSVIEGKGKYKTRTTVIEYSFHDEYEKQLNGKTNIDGLYIGQRVDVVYIPGFDSSSQIRFSLASSLGYGVKMIGSFLMGLFMWKHAAQFKRQQSSGQSS